MYRPYFGLNDLPFKTTPDLQMFYKHGTRQEILDALLYTINRGDGIIKVTGEVGSGKTMLLRLLANQLSDNFEIIYINSPNLSAKDLLLYICSEINIKVDSSSPKFDLVNALKQRLVALHSANKNVVMLVDEAQSMTFDALEEIRLLSNLETSDNKLLQIVLFGQPELDVAIEHPEVRQLKSRITYSIYVRPFNVDEVKAYLNYRLRKVGYQGLDLFDARAAKKICKLSGGLPRSINILADKALMSAFSDGANTIKPKYIQLDAPPVKPSFMMEWKFGFVFLSIIALASLSYLLLNESGFNKVDSVSISDTISQNNEASSVIAVHRPQTSQPSVPEALSSVIDSNSEASKSIANTDGVPESPKSKLNPDTSVSVNRVNKDDKLAATAQNSHYMISTMPKAYIEKLLSEHKKTVQWLNNTDSNYMIQLSTRKIDTLTSALKFYGRLLPSDEPLRVLIDFHAQSDSFRIKFFYLDALSVSGISNNIANLPDAVARSKPFVTPISALKRNLGYTEQKLTEAGVRYD